MLVAVRLRPLTDKEKQQGQRSCCRVVGDQAVIIEKTSHGALLRSQQSFEKEYAFDVAFPEDATQAEVYTKTVQDVVPTILNGYHATVFAYGATGAGKTHTMMGSERDGLGPDVDDSEVSVDGIIPQALTDVFNLIEHRQVEEEYMKLHHGTTFEWQVLVSYLEVYNEQIRDLLRPSAKPLALREDAARGIVHVAGLHHEEAHSVSEVLQLLRRGNRHRKTEPTAANQVSSRSHAVIQVTVRHTTTTMISNTIPRKSVIEGKLSLIDLAGSERASSTLNRGLRLTEGANINKSLLALANCINSLSTQNRQIVRRNSMDCMSNVRKERGSGEGMLSRFRSSKVQYRDSKLTHLLKNSLEGDCRLVMIANINPSHTSFDESHNTLKYANRAKNIKVRPRMHLTTAQMSYEQRIEKLEKENVVLRTALTEAYEDLGYEPHEQPVPLDFGRTGARSPGIPQRKVCPRRPSVQEPESDDTETDSDGSISTSLKQRDEELAQMRASAMQREAELSRLRVAVRLRPITDRERREGHRVCTKVVGDQVVVIEKAGQPTQHLRSQQTSRKEYAFDIAFPEHERQSS
ncbi:TPA: hypothetical protein N0F65_002581 [Lagenidium giganteum]|uniref:Kinesin-like protein n=1 Tax=Lagenidium giganteum TaxID=4803 RepID=A0AAV2Z032_9STRA|nr:TPA: hypothetical protein N0F65_002581 [Lagenidium giganteum]